MILMGATKQAMNNEDYTSKPSLQSHAISTLDVTTVSESPSGRGLASNLCYISWPFPMLTNAFQDMS